MASLAFIPILLISVAIHLKVNSGLFLHANQLNIKVMVVSIEV